MKQIIIKKETYFDSVFLMRVDQELKKFPGIIETVVAMATPNNKEILNNLHFLSNELSDAGPNDLVIAIEAETEKIIKQSLENLEKIVEKNKTVGSSKGQESFSTFQAALRELSIAQLALISVPGEYATFEARKCLNAGLNVMIFSDNVSLEQEIELKNIAISKGLLLMGPDCGTAIINGVPLAFANVIKPGPIGIVGASGTGIQEVTSLIDSFGSGITQAIGTGGRDLSEHVEAKTALLAIEKLADDSATKVIVVISKPPSTKVAKKVIAKLKTTGKPGIVHFLGIKPEKAIEDSVYFANSLLETASLACQLSGTDVNIQEIDINIEEIAKKITGKRKYLRGLFTGGTLCDEAIMVCEDTGLNVYSNIHHKSEFRLANPLKSQEHTLIDLGDDTFTIGRPHPMIEPATRNERIATELSDPEVAVLLFDVVLGFGSHPDPAGALVEALGNKCPCVVIASITGTSGDYQNYEIQKQKLIDAGILVLPSNYHAAICATEIIKKYES